MPIDYSKWDHIEISDDEDDTHPNIDTPSLFRWRHRARLERDEAFKQEKEEFTTGYKKFLESFSKCQLELGEAEKNNSPNQDKLRDQMKELKEKEKEWKKKEAEMQKKERLKPLNIDTICKDSTSRTIINKTVINSDKEKTEEETVSSLMNFRDKYDDQIKNLGFLQRPDDTETYLLEHIHLVCEETANHLVLWCIDLAMEEKFDLMNHVSHQCIALQFMLELAKSLKRDPRACIRPFFAKFKNPEPEYKKAFDDELSAFRDRIRKRAKERVEEAVAEYEAEEREKRLGPGGLDPLEVIETLPAEMRECFEKKDVGMLKDVIVKMAPADADYHMKRCIDSGLWVENANEAGEDGTEATNGGDQQSEVPTGDDATVVSKDTDHEAGVRQRSNTTNCE